MNRQIEWQYVRRAMLHVLAAAGAGAGLPAHGIEIGTGNPDLAVRWDNTVRYNLGIRAKDCDVNICGNGAGAGDISAHQSDRKFGSKGDIVTNRLDLLTELDVVYKESMGLRVSAAGWYDHAYRDAAVGGDPVLLAAGMNSFPTGEYTDYIKRWNKGPSGEFLDAFVFGKFNAGNVPVSVKLGQHNVYWGESLFSFVGGVANSQGPVDIRKALANPGSEAKELFKPLNQVSASASLTDRISVAGQYFFDWKPSTLPDGGTYFGPADFFTAGGGTQVAFFGGAPFRGTVAPEKKRGDWGLSAKWRPDLSWFDGSLGLYYRRYTDKLPQMVFDGSSAFLDYRTPRQTLIGLSVAKQIAGISFGSDLTYRKDAQIAAVPFANVGPFVVPGLAGGGIAPGAHWRPRGEVFTGLVNMIAYVGKTPVFDSAVLTAEVNYSRLRKVTFDPYGLYYGRNELCPEPTNKGCPTKDAWGIAVLFEPKWFQAWAGTDLSLPIFWGQGLKGNSPVPFGDNEGQGSYSIGVTADVKAKYNFALKYNGFLAKHGNDAAGIASNSNASLGKFWDRNWVSLTFKTTF